MSITTDSIIDIGTYTEYKIGLSKTINQYTADEIYDYAYCSSSWDMFRHINDTSYDDYCPGRVEESEFEMPFHYEGMLQNFMPAGYNYSPGQIQYNQGEKGIYGKIIWLCKTGQTSMSYYGTQRCITNTDDVKIVTQMDMTKVYLFLGNYITPTTGNNNINYLDYDNFKIKEEHSGVTDYSHPANCSVFPAVMFIYNNKLYIHRLTQNSYTSLDWSWWLSYYGDTAHGGHTEKQGYHFNAQPVSFDNSAHAYLPININRSFTGLRPTTVERHYTASVDIADVGISYQWEYAYVGGRITSASLDKYLQNASWYGCMFMHSGTYYKPVIENGYVTGYTDDMTTPSDIDNWTDATRHDVPPAPPGPTPPGPGYDDDPWSGVSFSGVGLGGGGAFARCYYMTSTELANLRSWMSGINVPEGFNPMAQIIGLSQIPVALSGDAPETVQFINSSAVYDPGITSRVVDSNVSTQYSMGGPIKYSLGSVDVKRRMQERGEPYLDYNCQIELYLPLIGVFSLDTQAVMGRTIEAEAILDPISGTLAAYAWVSQDGQKLPVAYGSTTISVDLPVTAQQYSVSKAALKQANAQLGTSLLSSVATLVAAAVGGGKAESSNARVSGGASSLQGARGMNSYAQASSIAASQAAISQTGNVVGDFMQWGRTIKQLQYGNNTAISGSFGGSVAQWSYPFNAYLKINRPRYEKPENYAHTQGVPCVQKKRIGDCTGFIQCIGVDVINIEGATDLERQAIQAALSSGIYAGGGGE